MKEWWDDFRYKVWKKWKYSWAGKLWWWFQYRLNPYHRYHTLKLGKPGYSDPRYYMIYAIMGMVERYVKELRVNWHPQKEVEDLSDAEVVQLYIDQTNNLSFNGFADDDLLNLRRHWCLHYADLKYLVEWWAGAKDHELLDSWSRDDISFLEKREYYEEEDVSGLTHEDVDEYLKLAVKLRTGMWT